MIASLLAIVFVQNGTGSGAKFCCGNEMMEDSALGRSFCVTFTALTCNLSKIVPIPL